MKTTVITTHKLLPDFIKKSALWKQIPEIRKIFPEIGLPNCSESVTKYRPRTAASIKQLWLKAFAANVDELYYCGGYPDEARRFKRATIYKALQGCSAIDFVKHGRIVVPSSAYKTVGNSFMRALRQCYSYVPGLELPHTGLTNRHKIVFTADGPTGMWDIATMSQGRGISSCQAWNGSYKYRLLGSIIDPYVGILYLTNGTQTAKGLKMLCRVLVRYVVNTKTHQPALLLERAYSDHSIRHHTSDVIALFKAFLRDKTSNKLPIVTSSMGYTIPGSSEVTKIGQSPAKRYDYTYDMKSYRDSGIGYSKSHKTYQHKLA